MTAVLLLLSLTPFLLISSADEIVPDAMAEASALLRFKSGFANPSALLSWSNGTEPCGAAHRWAGVRCYKGLVEALLLGSMNLSGTVDFSAFANLGTLRALSIAGNAFSGPIPNLHGLQALKGLYMSHNHFSGEIPADHFAGMVHLKKLWLAGNAFSGPIPSSLAQAKSLIELRLEDNRFTGPLPELASATLKQFNVANNALSGAVPASMARFNATAFAGNAGLCGPPLDGPPCEDLNGGFRRTSISGLGTVFAVLTVSGVIVLVAMFTRRRSEMDSVVLGKGEGSSRVVARSESAPRKSSVRRPETQQRAAESKSGDGLVIVNEEKGAFGLAELMRAAAETLGTGGLGTAYKVALRDGREAAVVKRMRGMNLVGKETFEVEIRRMGRLRHPNVLPPLAYHYRRDEKLLVSQFVPRGSLLYVLHGDAGPDQVALSWATRMKILRGIAGGLAYLHVELASHDVPHGNLKSANILLTPDFEPVLVDYGFVPLVNPSLAAQTLFAYRSPEALQQRHVSPKSDVYCLGIVILEVLTGKFPSQYLNNTEGGTDVVRWIAAAAAAGRDVAEFLDPTISCETSAVPEMERLLRVGVACAEPDPGRRPSVTEAVAQIEKAAA